MKRLLILFAACTAILAATAQDWPQPRPEARPGTRWWWLGSAVDTTNLRWNLHQYASHGLGTVEITPLYGVQGNDANNIPFLSDQWMRMLRFTEETGRSYGLQVDMNCGTGWPFGGPLVPIDEAACKAVFVDTVVDSRLAATIQLPPPDKERAYARLKLQRSYDSGQQGRTRVIALYESRTRQQVKRAAPGGQGYVIDHFDSTAVAHYLQRFEQAFAQTGTPYPHTFFNDSYEVYGADWTPTLLEQFAARRGYRLEDHLPQLLDGDPDVVSDYRETLSDLLLKNFTEQWAAWAHRHGVSVRNQAHGSPANLIDVYAAVDIPEIEGFGLSEFGIRGLRTDSGMTRKNFSDLSMLKYAPSAAHITGKPLTSSETFTWLTEHFRTSLSQMKPDMDLMFCAGVNHMFFHGTCYSPKDDPWPGWRFYASVDMSPNNSIWTDAPYFLKYIERCQSFLQWGKPDNDFLVYLPVRDMWRQDTRNRLMQFDIHAMNRKAPDFISAILTIDSLGFDCDYISDRYLLGTTFDGTMLRTAAGTRYKALIIPGHCTMPDNVSNHIKQLQQQGATVVWGINDTDMQRAATPEAMKTQLGLKLIRRSNDTGHHYFIANLSPNDVEQYVPLAVDYESAMWFDPMTGQRYATERRDGKLKVVLRSGESLILQTFRQSTPTVHQLPVRPYNPGPESLLEGMPHCMENYAAVARQIPVEKTLDGPWTLTFDSSDQMSTPRTYPIGHVQTWENLDDSTRVFMGTGTYECTFRLSKKELSAARNWQIDLGDVRESACVSINGQFVGCAWAVPFTLQFPSSLLKKGKNSLSIKVTNLPANRIAQLDRQHTPWRKFNEINVVDINYQRTTYEHWAPVPSGLASSVRLVPLMR